MKRIKLQRAAALLICMVFLASLSAALAVDGNALTGGRELRREWCVDQDFLLADPAPWNLEELMQVVDVTDPRSVAAYWVWAVTRLTDNYEDGMAMMKYLFADINPYDPEGGFTEGGISGFAGWDRYFDSRLSDPDYHWLPRAYFEGASPANGFKPTRPLTLELYFNESNTEAVNAQTLAQEGRLNIVYWVLSHAGQSPNQASIILSQFEDNGRWYVTSGTSSVALFYDQRAGHSAEVLALAAATPNDDSTAEEHALRYSGVGPEPEPEPETPFEDVPGDSYYAGAVSWAYNKDVTTGKQAEDGTLYFDPMGNCTRAEVVTFLWRAAGEPEPTSAENPFTDVTETKYYYKAVLWAVEQGITNGTSADEFSPNDTCSSAHIITFLYRALNHLPNAGWGDVSRDWAIDAGLTEETGLAVNNQEDCPRAAVVTFLYRSYAEDSE